MWRARRRWRDWAAFTALLGVAVLPYIALSLYSLQVQDRQTIQYTLFQKYLSHKSRLIRSATNGSSSQRTSIQHVTASRQAATLAPQLNPNFTWAPLRTTKPIFAHVLAYQRTGSTFFGDLFNEKPAVFFIYEPLDWLYTAMYGTKPGWNVPSDIFTYADGSVRTLPTHELEAQRWVLDTIFHCQMSTLPAAMLLHPFWQKFRFRMHVSELYHACLARRSEKKLKYIIQTLIQCQDPIRDICPPTFDNSKANGSLCLEVLWNKGMWNSAKTYDLEMWSYKIGEDKALRFQEYFECLASYEPILTLCAKNNLDRACKQKKVRMIKTVRSNMAVASHFLNKYTNYRLLHFFRDPRGTVHSRLHPNATWSLGVGEKGSVYQTALGYCKVVHQHFLHRQELETDHHGRILQVTFDFHTHNPMVSTSRIYSFVNTTHLASDARWHLNKIGLELKNANATLVAEKWRTEMSDKDINAVNSACSTMMQDITFR